jgi:CubicO group peptidase (beta-lactamase class C family)
MGIQWLRRLAGILATCAATIAAGCTPGRPVASSEPPPRLAPTWRESSPEAQGISSGDLADAVQFARTNNLNIHSLTVVRNGAIVLDAYFYPYQREMRHDVASVTKSVISLLIGMATADGFLEGVDQPVVSALSPRSTGGIDPRVARIRVGDLLAMQSGLQCGFAAGEPELRQMRLTADWAAYALHLPLTAEPGTRFGYCSPNYHVLSASIAHATRRTTLDYARARLFAPLGIDDVHWPADPSGVNHGWGDLQIRPRDMARIGLLMLQRGAWQGRQVVPVAWIDNSRVARAQANQNEDYGLGWWLSRRISTLFEANGRGGQRISVIPATNMVVVMTGGGFEPGDIGNFLLRAVRADTAIAADPVSEARLAQAVRLVAAPPPQHTASRSPTSGRVSGWLFKVEDNRMGLRSLAIDFPNRDEAVLHLRLASGAEVVQPLGLDGVYRIATDEGGAASAGRAEWLSERQLRIELNMLARINRYVIDAEFSGDTVRLTINEPTEVGSLTLRGDHAR